MPDVAENPHQPARRAWTSQEGDECPLGSGVSSSSIPLHRLGRALSQENATQSFHCLRLPALRERSSPCLRTWNRDRVRNAEILVLADLADDSGKSRGRASSSESPLVFSYTSVQVSKPKQAAKSSAKSVELLTFAMPGSCAGQLCVVGTITLSWSCRLPFGLVVF